jgi:hypothetical protein
VIHPNPRYRAFVRSRRGRGYALHCDILAQSVETG